MKASTIALLGGAAYLYYQQQQEGASGDASSQKKRPDNASRDGGLPPTDQPHYSNDVEKLLAELIEQGDAAKSDTGIVAGPNSGDDDRHALAVVECKRAVRDYGVPASQMNACVAAVEEMGGMFEYHEPGSRYVIEVEI